MCWGFSCGDGWFQLIWDLSEKLEPMIAAIDGSDDERPKASQVKEKFGTLRFYMTSSTDEMESAIGEAEARSAVTCEHCGRPGVLRSEDRYWVLTLCDLCDAEDRAKKGLRDG